MAFPIPRQRRRRNRLRPALVVLATVILVVLGAVALRLGTGDHARGGEGRSEEYSEKYEDTRRLEFANDPRNLVAVSPAANFAKTYRDAAGWLPPAEGFRCEFVARQVEVKTAYGLWVSPNEKRAMADVLADC